MLLVSTASGAITAICRRAVANEGGDCRAAQIPAPAVRERPGTEWGFITICRLQRTKRQDKLNGLIFVTAELTCIVSDSKRHKHVRKGH